MTPKLYKASEVCEATGVQPYVLRSWEKEFPGIGVQKSPESTRLYRQSDVDQVLRIKQLVFGEGLTLAGARRRLDEMAPQAQRDQAEANETLDLLASNARLRISHVKQGLRSLLDLLDGRAVAAAAEEYQLQPPPAIERRETIGVGVRTAVAAKRAKRATA